MATTGEALRATPRNAFPGVHPGLRPFVPTLLDLFLLSLPVWLFAVGPDPWMRLLMDGDTGWHIRTGDWIRAHSQAPRTDIFGAAPAGRPWFAWEWLSGILFSWMHEVAGFRGLVVWGALLISLSGVVTLRHCLWRRANPLIALLVTILFYSAASVHALARPHLWTLLFITLSWWVLAHDHHRPGRWLWSLAPLTALWANLHGGWIALPASLIVFGAGTAVAELLGERLWRRPTRYLAAAALCLSASLLNPYGWELHRHMLGYLRAGWIREMVAEFRSPSFTAEALQHYEFLLVAALCFAYRLWRQRRLGELALLLFWAHASLTSARHIPIFVAFAVPVLAAQAGDLWRTLAARAPARSTLAIVDSIFAGSAPGFQRLSVWPAAVAAACFAGLVPAAWPQLPPADLFPEAVLRDHAPLLSSRRVFTSDQWSDYLIYRLYPRQRVLFDGRSDLYGETYCRQMVAIQNGAWNWARLLDFHRVEAVLAQPSWPLASLLKLSPGWQLVEDRGNALLFVRRLPVPEKTPASALMKWPKPAEWKPRGQNQ